uniref:E3 ubiquitin-protein ligase n=1 Tax=Cyclopterus lumpus TaxID=8103 RepID=A0A8C2WRG7_CYCLU
MTTSFLVAEIKTKFNVDFKESFMGQGKVKIKAYHNRLEGNVSMVSHAVRALLQLYQKMATSPMSFTWQNQSEGASGGRGLDGQSGYNTGAATGGGATAGDPAEDENCPICMDKCTNKKQLKCTHEFCAECLEKSTQVIGPTCPVCKDIFGLIEGDQPDGEMKWTCFPSPLPGFPDCGSITIYYNIQSGVQTKKHSNPGKHYYGLTRTAYLPDNKEGNEVLKLLKKAFDQRLIFTVGTSRTTGKDNQVTWNDIHHKTNMTGGAAGFGYPDDRYLGRVKEELKRKISLADR